MQAQTPLINHEATARAVLAEQVKMLMAQLPVSIIMSFLLISFVSLVFGELVAGRQIFVWWCLMSALFLAQYFFYVNYTRTNPRAVDYQYWLKFMMISAGIIGLGWSAGLTMLLDAVAEQNRIFLIVLLISLAAGAITFAIRTVVYCIYQVAVLGPAIIWLLLQDSPIQMILGVFMAIFMVAMWLFAMHISRTLAKSFTLQIENQSLAGSLKQSNARLHVLNEELTQLSATDSLTQVANRRYFDNRFISEFSRASREGTALAIIMIDVDFFKAYNDHLGHVAGDECLQRIAICIRDSLKRPTDLVARYGGEEFIVLLPSTSVDGALSLAEEIRIQVANLKISHPVSKVSPYITVSLGVTGAYPGKDVSRESLLKKADEALYNAKAAGRNCMCSEIIETQQSQKAQST